MYEVLEVTVPAGHNDFIMRVMLDGALYIIHMSYNSTGDFWTLGFLTSDETPIVDGIKIVPNFPLNFWYMPYDVPQGLIWVKSSAERIGKNAFSDGSAKLCYVS